ncbi:MAG: hypothetical protein P1U54_02990 [Immundisolibacteraceae bacterium]|nr:hypothetical protein [Immundisolibacteraceae bacterium]
MADILPFKKPTAAQKNRGKTLCSRGFHQWKADKETRFDSQQGNLVTRYVCQRCGKTRVPRQ